MLLTPDEVRATLPRVGDEMMLKPTFYYGFYAQADPKICRPCVVTYVHTKNMWFSVRFKDSGIVESYKLPEVHTGVCRGVME